MSGRQTFEISYEEYNALVDENARLFRELANLKLEREKAPVVGGSQEDEERGFWFWCSPDKGQREFLSHETHSARLVDIKKL